MVATYSESVLHAKETDLPPEGLADYSVRASPCISTWLRMLGVHVNTCSLPLCSSCPFNKEKIDSLFLNKGL